MQSYHEYIHALDNLLKEVKQLPCGGWPELSKPDLLENAPKILIFSPHPDDEVFIGHLPLRLMRESKMQVTNIALTLGSNKDRRSNRLQELRNCCRYIGFDLVTVSDDGFDSINEQTRENDTAYWSQCVDIIISILDQHRPEIIFFPHAGDWHATHIGTHLLVVDALKLMPPDFSCYCVETETWGAMNDPNLLIECNNNGVADLITALSFHRGEVERSPYHLRIAARLIENVMRGAERIGGPGSLSPEFQFAMLYRLSYWRNGKFNQSLKEGRFLSAGEDPTILFQNNYLSE